MSKVLLDHVPPSAPTDRRTRSAPRPQGRSRTEAGVLGLVLAAILVFAAGFAAVFPESEGSTAFWPTYRDPSGVFELRYPRGWDAAPSTDGVRLAGEEMWLDVSVRPTNGAGVDLLAQQRVVELSDLGAAEVTTPGGAAREGTAVRHLADGDGRVTIELFLEIDERSWLSVVATAAPGGFDQATFDSIVDTFAIREPDESLTGTRLRQSRP